jgi:hypothetical protein
MSATNGKDPEGLQKAVTFADFVRMLERGELHQELSDMLREIAASMENHAMENGGAAKAKLSLTIDFKLDKGIYEISAKPKVTLPEPKRADCRLGLAGELLLPAGSEAARHVRRAQGRGSGLRDRQRLITRIMPDPDQQLVFRHPPLHSMNDSELLEATDGTEAGALADIIKDNFKPEVKSSARSTAATSRS